jgi:nitrile hydratase accessory protein
LSEPDSAPPEPDDADAPAFAHAWQARAFALAVKLSEAGHFTWKEWTLTLADELRGEADDGSRYFEHWLAALERLTGSKGLVDAVTLGGRREEWAEAHRRTPHGQPVTLGAPPESPARDDEP